MEVLLLKVRTLKRVQRCHVHRIIPAAAAGWRHGRPAGPCTVSSRSNHDTTIHRPVSETMRLMNDAQSGFFSMRTRALRVISHAIMH